MDFWHFLGDLHPKLVHFPLVLLPAGLLFDAAGLLFRSSRCHWAARILTGGGTVLLLVTFICGIYAEVWAGRAGVPQQAIELHELFANVASWGFVVLAAWRVFLKDEFRRSLALYTFLGFAWYVLMGVTAHLGGALVYDYGAAVTGARASLPPSLHDLNTLAVRQTDLNLRYSEMMHHIFGYLTLALAGSLFAHALFPRQANRLRWVGPGLLLAGGIFLFFCADLDLYRLTDLRQLRDREVQLHKTIAIVLAVAGVTGLRRARGRKPATENTVETRSFSPPPGAVPSGAGGFQGKMVAVMALIGGGLLFTHVHTVAPYANVAAGVYIAHIVLGSVALLIGAARLAADAWPAYRRPLSVCFAALLCVESVLLITYNEGLPWYVGYGHYNRWGPHGGTIAPFGDRRAELVFDDRTRRLDLYLLDRFKDEPFAVRSPALDLYIDRGYQETRVRIPADDAARNSTGGNAHFSVEAPFLKGASAFCARLELPAGEGPGRHTRTGYFDPWVTPLIANGAVPPNEVAMFQCPMHEGIRSTKPGQCPLCNMALALIVPGLRTTLHDPAYGMRFEAGDAQVASTDEPANPLSRRLRFTPTRDNAVLKKLEIVHEHPLHLIVVSEDLRFFDHVHPLPKPDGSLELDYAFPAEGRFLLYADITPPGSRGQVFRLPVTIGHPTPASAAADADSPDAFLAGTTSASVPQDPALAVEMVTMPRALVAGPHAELVFRLTRDARPVTDLEPYLGAMGHCVIVSRDTQTYLHCHPEQLLTPAPADRGGPDVVFHTRFPRAGRYRIWAQFKRSGKIIVATFDVRVEDALLPPEVMAFLFDD